MALLIPLSKLPLALDAGVERVEPKTGLPTTATLDAEFALTEWTKRNVVDTERRTTLVEGSTGTLSGRVEDIAEVVSDADGNLIAHRLTDVVTQSADNSADLQILAESVNGLSVRYSVIGNINNVTGGFELTGVQRADGNGAVFSFDIYANTRIHGDLVVSGTINTPQLAANSVSNSNSSTSADTTNPSTSVTLTLRANSRVQLYAVYMARQGAGQNANTTGTINFTIDGGPALQTTSIGYRLFSAQTTTTAATGNWALTNMQFVPQTTPALLFTSALSAGSHTFTATAGGGGGNVVGIVSLIVTELRDGPAS